ncbi:hypothetical protein EDB80DRAFT_37028 [Ilyonectria destructans]|nr:hypothetical protein EDB80DRAFT_37028 [Ilyonectria destructans]
MASTTYTNRTVAWIVSRRREQHWHFLHGLAFGTQVGRGFPRAKSLTDHTRICMVKEARGERFQSAMFDFSSSGLSKKLRHVTGCGIDVLLALFFFWTFFFFSSMENDVRASRSDGHLATVTAAHWQKALAMERGGARNGMSRPLLDGFLLQV